MSMEDLFGSDLEDSDDEDKVKSRRDASDKAQIDELFGDSSSEGEERERESGEGEEGRRTPTAHVGDDDEGETKDDGSVSGENLSNKETDQHRPKGRHMSSADLFGDELSSDEEQRPREELGDAQQEEATEPEQRAPVGEGEEQEEEEEETRIDVTIPYCRFALGAELFFVKTPNFLSLESKPFDSALYEDEMEDEEILDEEGRARLKLKVENTIRWRWSKDKDGNDIKESNARVVRWSDGTMSLLLGGEVFDIHRTKIEGDFNHLFVQQGTGLQGQAVFKEKLTFRPHSTASQTHRKMTLSIADRASKAQKIRILPAAGKDPEAMRSELIKKEEERLRAQVRRESQQRRMRERSHNKGLSSSFLERDEDEEDLEQSLLALKKKYKKKLAEGSEGEEEEGEEDSNLTGGLESDDDEEGQERLRKAKEGIDSGDDSDSTRRKRTLSDEGGSRKKKKSRKIVESDDEDSD